MVVTLVHGILRVVLVVAAGLPAAASDAQRWGSRTRSTGGRKVPVHAALPSDEEVMVPRYFSPPYPPVVAAVLVTTLALGASAVWAQAPSIEGTYWLVSRTLKDGTVFTPPEVMGLQTYTKRYRNFNILSKDADGQFVSRSIVATYTLTPTEYIETTLFHLFVRGQEIRHEVSTPPQRSAVTLDAGRIQFRTEQRVAVYEGNRFTATSPASVDVWEKAE